ncbi:2-oxoglutarate dehydrogenase E1 component [Candidatus Tisiphia endosymbiont of Beris chalybata]|uniref:2-oxoglutarate dehydrogenase E1 component n=1 Tax=Candidatus Tisiphia endosymbiont of Beris chalybata TaxID=3066262 RepID=UPI00312C92BB
MNKDLTQTSFLFGSNAVFIEELYQIYLLDKNAVDESWHNYFQNINDSKQKQVNKSTAKVITIAKEELLNRFQESGFIGQGGRVEESTCQYSSTQIPDKMRKQLLQDEKYTSFNTQESFHIANTLRAKAMIAAYRKYAHYLVQLDPLELETPKTKNDLGLNIESFGFTNGQLNSIIELDNELFAVKSCTLARLVELLDQSYGKHIAVEFDHIVNDEEKTWLFEQVENSQSNLALLQDKKKILKDLIEVEGFEQYLHVKFPGAKRFSIEGAEAAVVAIDQAIDISMAQGVEDVVIGMSHRGRISTLAKVMAKPYKAIMAGFITGSAFPDDLKISGDVKYHVGYSADRERAGRTTHLSMAFNPSHLEAVNSVVAGQVRAKQDTIMDIDRKAVLGILVHGDSAFCGQGVVAESLSMSELQPYNIGGIVHFVVNNQLGFTANSIDSRISRYSTEFAKVINVPILHVNGDDIEAVLQATNIAMNYRHKFARDVVIEIICYRKYGHNEGDEPMYTQAIMYNIIKNKLPPPTIYANTLLKDKLIQENYLSTLKEQFKLKLDEAYEQSKKYQPKAQFLEKLWTGYKREDKTEVVTGVNISILKELGIRLCQVPGGFPLNAKLIKLFELRENTLRQDKPIDWATGEQLAFATLLRSGTNIRFTGQDSERGTFSHRHAVLHSQLDSKTYLPLNNIAKNQGIFEISDSNLSEYAVLGFEFGYSLVNPKNLVIWEAQFGDFANGAQIIFDQFISSCEDKWLRMSGLVVLLPHGYEGQGSEHSSARLERFLQLAANNNIQVTYPTTPASFFHLLRRQIYSSSRKPLIVMSPKSLLRHKMVVSPLSAMDENTSFIPVLDEMNKEIDITKVKKIILCTGKVYYDLLEMRSSKNMLDRAIIRLEQLYPFAKDMLIKILARYGQAKEFIWCQEEPKNMGAWGFIRERLNDCLQELSINNQFQYVGREESASPATNLPNIHNKQQQQLLEDAIK